ncbi:MAG: hypothetical protein OJF50_004619 [Nitrospira sp.]|nr:hypothetical protein [Nitrospira sp.]
MTEQLPQSTSVHDHAGSFEKASRFAPGSAVWSGGPDA